MHHIQTIPQKITLTSLMLLALTLSAQTAHSETLKHTIADQGFVYKSDPRSFDQKPQDMTAKNQGWTNQQDNMVLVTPSPKGSMRPFYIDSYEAFISNYRAWSVPGVHPTDKIKYGDARTACTTAGKRLCHVEEWRTACRGGYTKPITFKDIQAVAQNCDFARSNTYDQNDYVEKTNSHPRCTTPNLKIYHMIGNVAEFVETSTGQIMIVGLTYYDGKMKNKQTGLKYACERVVANPGQYPATRYNKGTGFRCCRNAR